MKTFSAALAKLIKAWVVTLVIILCVTTISYAQKSADNNDPSCWGAYERFTLRSFNEIEQCILETNSQGYLERFPARLLCHARWASNALQAEADYFTCMSFGKVIGVGKR